MNKTETPNQGNSKRNKLLHLLALTNWSLLFVLHWNQLQNFMAFNRVRITKTF